MVRNGPGVIRCAHLIGVGGLDNDNVDLGVGRGGLMAGCIATNHSGWFLCLKACVAFPILKALMPGGTWFGVLIY